MKVLFFTFFVLVSPFVQSEPDSCHRNKADVISRFEEYRAASVDSNNLAQFYSKGYNEEWVDDLTKKQSDQVQLQMAASISLTLRSPIALCNVHKYEIELHDDDAVSLGLYYSVGRDYPVALQKYNYKYWAHCRKNAFLLQMHIHLIPGVLRPS